MPTSTYPRPTRRSCRHRRVRRPCSASETPHHGGLPCAEQKVRQTKTSVIHARTPHTGPQGSPGGLGRHAAHMRIQPAQELRRRLRPCLVTFAACGARTGDSQDGPARSRPRVSPREDCPRPRTPSRHMLRGPRSHGKPPDGSRASAGTRKRQQRHSLRAVTGTSRHKARPRPQWDSHPPSRPSPAHAGTGVAAGGPAGTANQHAHRGCNNLPPR